MVGLLSGDHLLLVVPSAPSIESRAHLYEGDGEAAPPPGRGAGHAGHLRLNRKVFGVCFRQPFTSALVPGFLLQLPYILFFMHL